MLRALFFIPLVIIATATGALAAMAAGLFKKYSHFSTKFVLRPWGRLLLWAAGTKVERKGLDNIQPGQAYVIISNHQSQMDIPLLIASLPLRMTIIAKKELFRIPVFGQGMRAFGILEIDRGDRSRAIATLKQAAAIMQYEEISVLAFPEGTRSRTAEIQPFKKGPFILAIHTGLPILPVSVAGTFSILPKGELRVRPGRVTVTIHPPLETREYNIEDRDRLIRHVHQTVSEGVYEQLPESR